MQPNEKHSLPRVERLNIYLVGLQNCDGAVTTVISQVLDVERECLVCMSCPCPALYIGCLGRRQFVFVSRTPDAGELNLDGHRPSQVTPRLKTSG